MLRRQLACTTVASLTLLALSCSISFGVAGPQDKTEGQPHADETKKEQTKVAPRPPAQGAEKRAVQIAKMIADYDLKPHPLSDIPDDPPPHEGAMIGLPYIVEPPDLLLVEVLEALPGMPVSGERLVRPDGKISIGFYGDVYVKGLTLEQVKVAIIKHLRRFLADGTLGLEVPEIEEPAENLPPPPPPEVPAGARNPFDVEGKPKEISKPPSTSARFPSVPRVRVARASTRQGRGVRVPQESRPSRVVRVSSREYEAPARIPNPIAVRVGPPGKASVANALFGPVADLARQPQPDEPPQDVPILMGVDDVKWTIVPPAESDRVFVDVTAYNSKAYFILGDVMIPGKLPWTGNETVLDALEFAGGLLPSAEPRDIRLVRPPRGSKPARVYKIDLAAIQDNGDITANYQIFPGDRLIVGRNEVVKKTVEIDRLNAPIQSIVGSILQEEFMLRYLQFVTAENREELLKEFVDFWAKEISRPGGVKFDEKTLRDALMRQMKLTPPPLPTAPAPR